MFLCLISLVLCYVAVLVIQVSQKFLERRPVFAAIARNPSLALRALKLYLYARSERARSDRTPAVQAERIHYKIAGGDIQTNKIEEGKMSLLDRSVAESIVVDYVYEGCFKYKMAFAGSAEKGCLVEDVNAAVLKRIDVVSGINTVYSVTSNVSEPCPSTEASLMEFFGPLGSPPDISMFDHFDPSVVGTFRVHGTAQSFDVDFGRRTITAVSISRFFR